MKIPFPKTIMMLLVTFGVWGCAETGSLSLSLTDAATDQYDAVYVTIDRVEVHQSGDADVESGWEIVVSPGKTYNLLELSNGVREELGMAELESGTYTQVRLILGDTPDDSINIQSRAHPYAHYTIDADGEVHELVVPSGYQTGVKIVHPFEVSVDGTTELILDFEATASVVIAGSSGQYLLKPTIRIFELTEFARVEGTVTDANGAAVEGAVVSAQQLDAAAADSKDEVTVESSTATSASGQFALFLEPDSYKLVVNKEGYATVTADITLAAGDTATQDFSIAATSTGMISGMVTIPSADAEVYASLSFRSTVELISINVANGGTFTVTVPAGAIEVVASSADQTTVVEDVTVSADATTTLDILFE